MENNIVPEKDLDLIKSNIMDGIIDTAVYLKAVIRFQFSPNFHQTIKRTKCKLFGHTWQLRMENNQPYFCKSCTKLYDNEAHKKAKNHYSKGLTDIEEIKLGGAKK